jgi:hypothetical protein
MTSHRFGFLVAVTVVAVTVVGYAWSEKTSSESRFTSKVSGQCPMSAGTDAASCPYLRGSAGAGADAGATSGNGCTRMDKDARKGAGNGTSACPYGGGSGRVDAERARGTVKAALRDV